MQKARYENIAAYIADFPAPAGKMLELLRKTIVKNAPKATALISYNMPAFKQEKILVYFACHTNHIGLYPGPAPIAAFAKELSAYKTAKGSIQFPLEKPLPVDLIAKIVQFKVKLLEEKLALQKPDLGWKKGLTSPAIKALDNAGINTLKKLASSTEKDIGNLHGMGPGSLLKLKKTLQSKGLAFKK
ncbi:MAG: hypothetical protein RLZZ28_345 [Bacteroidota bacterium]